MASDKNQPAEEQNGVEALNENLTNLSRRVETNKKALYVAFGAIILIAAATFGYIYLFRNPKLNKAYDALNQVEITAMGNDSISAAEYSKVGNEYSSTAAGKLAKLSAAESFYNLGKYQEAARELEGFSCDDAVLEANAQTLLGDCYVNLKKYDQAIETFNKALKTCDANPQIAPRVILKKAVVFDAQKKYDKALECYEDIKANYPKFTLGNGMTVDAYIEREKARLGK